MKSSSRHRSRMFAAVAAILALTITSCGSSAAAGDATAEDSTTSTTEQQEANTAPDSAADDTAADGTADTSEDTAGSTVRLLTHDSFAVSPETLADFEAETGITVEILAQGDAGETLSKAILTTDNPLGDVIFGIDNSFASKALNADILVPYVSPLLVNGADKHAIDDDNRLTAIDFGDVCVNIDHTYFDEHSLAEPVTLQDLTKPEYANLFVTPDAQTSSPGLSFMFATIAHFGADGYLDYWQQLKDNGVKITSGWTEAYTVDFSGSSGEGDRPLVLSYASSPPSEVGDDGQAPTGALLDTCFRQVEYAGILSGSENQAAAEQVIDFLLSEPFQQGIASTMWMYPVDTAVELPAEWAKYAPVADNTATLDPADIDAHREAWLADWTDLMRG